MLSLNSVSLRIILIFSDKSKGSRGVASKPVSEFKIVYCNPPVLEATTGTLQAIASKGTMPKGS